MNRMGRIALLAVAPTLVTMLLGMRLTAHDGGQTYRVIWQDTFNESSLDTTKWRPEASSAAGQQTCCLGDGLQQWTPSNVSVTHGDLALTSESTAAGGYTSGAVTTFGTFSFTYGRVDITAQLPKGDGLWSAFWMLPTVGFNGKYAADELDIAEVLGQDTTTAYTTAHWNYGNGREQCTTTQLPDLSAAFHTYSLVWTPTSVTWLLDGAQRCKSTEGVPQQPMYLILNTYVGGSWPVAPNASTILPQQTRIASVTVSQAA